MDFYFTGKGIGKVDVFLNNVLMVQSLSAELRKVTLCFLLKRGQVLLAMKKRGFGVGKWNGYGGKVQSGETVEAAAVRELNEESGVEAAVADLYHVATLRFYFKKDQTWNQEVYVYGLQQWSGEPVESEEMRPQWFAFERIPYGEMWVDDTYWLPQVLQGKKLEAEFYFNDAASGYEKLEVREVTKLK